MADTLTRTCGIAGADDIASNRPGYLPPACGEPAMALITFACVHEHVDRVLACAACACEIQRASGLLVCEHCEDLCDGSDPGPHECLVRFRIEWSSGEVTDG